VQSELDSARRELVAQLSKCVRTTVTGAVVVPRKQKRSLAWREVQLTPELSIDPDLSGLAVLKADLERLRVALRAQAAVLRPLLR